MPPNPMDSLTANQVTKARMELMGRNVSKPPGWLWNAIKAKAADETGALNIGQLLGGGGAAADPWAGPAGRVFTTPGGRTITAEALQAAGLSSPQAFRATANPIFRMPQGKAGLAKGLGWGIAGQLGGTALDQMGAPDFMGDAARGAGAGAMFGPWGALAGGVAGGVLGATGVDVPIVSDLLGIGGPSPEEQQAQAMKEQRKTVNATLASTRKAINAISPQLSTAARAQLKATMKATNALPKEQRIQLRQQLLMELPAQVAQQAEQSQAAQQRAQLLAGAIMGNAGVPGVANAQQYQQQIQGLLPQLPEQFQGMAQMMGNRAVYDANNMQNAYQQTLMSDPVVSTMNNQLSQLRQLQQQIQAQQQGGGSNSLADLLAAGQ